jgi:hypothetical protein
LQQGIAAGALLTVSKTMAFHFPGLAVNNSLRGLKAALSNLLAGNLDSAEMLEQAAQQQEVLARTRQITGNQLIAAVVLHQRRKRTAIRCSAHFPKQLSNLCQLQNYNADHRSVARTYMVSPLQPFGVDPSFNARSSMYHPYAAQRPWQYYNTTAGSSEVSDSGVPYAFFHRPAIGLKDGFPIVFPVCHSS